MIMPDVRNTLLVLILFLVSGLVPARALDLKVGLFHDHLVRTALVSVVEGRFRVQVHTRDSLHSDNLKYPAREGNPGESWVIVYSDDGLYLRDPEGDWTAAGLVDFFPLEEHSVFSLKPADPVLNAREYHGGLRVDRALESLRMLNLIDLETYIMGVAETEAGPGQPLEYYKVQAILCRTFALRNLERHLEEGFNLCDGIHCQSYKGRQIWSEDAEIGTEVTSALVLCLQDTVLINPVYHANSGGETCGAGMVWLKEEPYLKAVLDPFSLGQKNASWESRIPVGDWVSYLRSRGISVPESARGEDFEMRMRHRQEYYRVFADSLRVGQIRDDFNYRSDFFDVLPREGMILIRGRGYGHGVGLSQEGAMEMARRHYHYTAILNYYYYGISIVPYFDLKPLISH